MKKSVMFLLVAFIFLVQSALILKKDDKIRVLEEAIVNSEDLVIKYQQTLYGLIKPMKFPEYVLYSKEEYAKILKDRKIK